MGVAADRLQSARHPAVLFANNIGDAVLTLPTLRALAERFAAPLTVLCPAFAFDLCFHEVTSRFVDISRLLPHPSSLTPLLPSGAEYDALAEQVGAVDVLMDLAPWNMPATMLTRPLWERLAPTTTVGFRNDDQDYDIALPRDARHAADVIFALAQLLDPSARIEDHAQPLPIPAAVREEAAQLRAAVPPGRKLLVVHADTEWTAKRWPVTRFVDLLDRFLSRHPDHVAWVVGMGQEELNVGRERDRVIPHLGLPLDLAMSMVATADLFLGIDSCMLHAADLAAVPGVGLFGPTRGSTWGFRFGPHRHLDRATMADITVAEVLGALEELA